MYDFGKPYRQQFLNEELIDRKQEKQVQWILFVAVVYFGGHLGWYLMSTI